MKPNELTIEYAQKNQPWTVPYSSGVNWAACEAVPHIHGTHTILHAAKTVGKLATVFEMLDHRGEPISDSNKVFIAEMTADLVTAALRLANLYEFDLATVFVRRVEEKNAVNILNLEKEKVS